MAIQEFMHSAAKFGENPFSIGITWTHPAPEHPGRNLHEFRMLPRNPAWMGFSAHLPLVKDCYFLICPAENSRQRTRARRRLPRITRSTGEPEGLQQEIPLRRGPHPSPGAHPPRGRSLLLAPPVAAASFANTDRKPDPCPWKAQNAEKPRSRAFHLQMDQELDESVLESILKKAGVHLHTNRPSTTA